MQRSAHPGPPPEAAAQPVRHVDGNALAGLLTGIFAGDMTLAVLGCGHCGREGPLANAVVEDDSAAAIIRCRACTRTLLTILRTAGGLSIRFAALARLDVAI